MSFFYITGPTGAGKTTVKNELIKLGYKAYDTDEGINAHFNIKTGSEAEYPAAEKVTLEWLGSHRYLMPEKRIRLMHMEAQHGAVFLCGAAYNDLDMIKYFDKVFCLTVDKKTAEQRVLTRQTNDFGKVPSEMKSILDRHDIVTQKYLNAGVIIIDTFSMNVTDIVNQILQIAGEK